MDIKKIKSVLLITFILIFTNTVYANESIVDFSKLFDNHGLVRLIIDADSGAIEYGNKAAVNFYGYSKEELTTMKIQDINVLDSEFVAVERIRAYTEENNRFLFKHRLANGEIKNVEVHSYPVLEDGKKSLYSVIIDISSQVKLESS